MPPLVHIGHGTPLRGLRWGVEGYGWIGERHSWKRTAQYSSISAKTGLVAERRACTKLNLERMYFNNKNKEPWSSRQLGVRLPISFYCTSL